MKEPLNVPPHTRTRWDDALDTLDEVRGVISVFGLFVRTVITAIFLCIMFGIAGMYLVTGHAAGRVVGVVLLGVAIWLTRTAIRGVREEGAAVLEEPPPKRPRGI
jgi:hypothetical protein